MPISATAVDCHRIACEAFEGPGGRDKSRFQNAARRRIAEAGFENPDEAFQHCNASYDHWVSDGITEPSKLTSVIPLEVAKDWLVDTVDALPPGNELVATIVTPSSGEDQGADVVTPSSNADQGATIVAPSSDALDALQPGEASSQPSIDVVTPSQGDAASHE
jgi:hypothetical protein